MAFRSPQQNALSPFQNKRPAPPVNKRQQMMQMPGGPGEIMRPQGGMGGEMGSMGGPLAQYIMSMMGNRSM